MAEIRKVETENNLPIEAPVKEEPKAVKPVPAKPAGKSAKKVPVSNKKPNIFKRMWRKIKEVFGELKKVTWPTFRKTLGQTGVVIVVVIFFIVIIGLADLGLTALYHLLTNNIGG